MSVLDFNIVAPPVSQPPPRKLRGAALARLCRKDPAIAAVIAVDLSYGRIEVERPTTEQSIALAGTTASDYSAARAKAAAARSRR